MDSHSRFEGSGAKGQVLRRRLLHHVEGNAGIKLGFYVVLPWSEPAADIIAVRFRIRFNSQMCLWNCDALSLEHLPGNVCHGARSTLADASRCLLSNTDACDACFVPEPCPMCIAAGA